MGLGRLQWRPQRDAAQTAIQLSEQGGIVYLDLDHVRLGCLRHRYLFFWASSSRSRQIRGRVAFLSSTDFAPHRISALLALTLSHQEEHLGMVWQKQCIQQLSRYPLVVLVRIGRL